MNHSEAIRLNNTGVSLLLAGRYRESAVHFAKSLGMVKVLLSPFETASSSSSHDGTDEFPRDHEDSSCDSPMTKAFSHQSGPTSLSISKQKRRRRQEDNSSRSHHTRKMLTQVHKSVSLPVADRRRQSEEIFMTFQEVFLLLECADGDQSDGEYYFAALKCQSACIIFNMAALHHMMGTAPALNKAEQLYRLAVEVNKGFLLSLTDSSVESIDGPSMIVTLASLNNLASLLLQRLEGTEEAMGHMQFMSRLLDISREHLLEQGVVTEHQWSGFVLNALLVDHRVYQAAAAA